MFTIFGHTGFLGHNLVKYLKNSKLLLPKRNKFTFNQNLGNIIYCIGSDDWKTDTFNSFNANLGFVPTIIEKNNFKSFTFVSSCRIYNNSTTTHETSNFKFNPTDTNEFYNLKKILAENYLFASKKKIKIVRVSNIVGFSPKSPLVFPMFVKNAITKKKIVISINKNSTKDFIHIDDVVQLIARISIKGKGKIYNIANGKNTKLIDLAQSIKKFTNCKILLKNQNKAIFEPKININKIKKEFNFKSKNILKNLNEVYMEYKNNF